MRTTFRLFLVFWAVATTGCAPQPTLVQVLPGTAAVRRVQAPEMACPGWAQVSRCDADEIALSHSDHCVRFTDMSPQISPLDGIYDAGHEPANWIQRDTAPVLELLAVKLFKNGEGWHLPHGPFGNLYWDVFREDEPIATSQDGANHRRIAEPRVLRGPHRTGGPYKDEWLPGESLRYRDAGLFEWGSVPGTEDAIVLRVWESDMRSEDGRLGRRNDVLGMAKVTREQTESVCGTWITLYRYTNQHPRKRTHEIVARLLVRTERQAEPVPMQWTRSNPAH